MRNQEKNDAVRTGDIENARWQKFIGLVAVSGLCAPTRRPIGDVRDDPDLGGLPGRSPAPRRTAPSDAGTARPRAVRAGGTAGDPRSGRRPNVVSPTGRNPNCVPPAATPVGGNAGNR